MPEIIFTDKSKHPSAKQLADALGQAYKHWQTIKEHVNKNYEPITDDWKFYGKNCGWQLKTLLKKRNLFFLIPYKSYFKIVFVFGDKAVKEIEQSKVAKELITELLNVKKYAEGRGLKIDVKNGKHIPDIKKLIEIKISSRDYILPPCFCDLELFKSNRSVLNSFIRVINIQLRLIMKKCLMLFLFITFIGFTLSGCDSCDQENPSVVLINNGTDKADIQVKTSGGNTENINNIEVGVYSERRTFAPGDIEFTISIQGVDDDIVYILSTSFCYDYTVTINEDNTVTYTSQPRD